MATTALNKYGDVGPRIGIQLIKRLLKRGLAVMVAGKYAQKDMLQKNAGKIAKFRRYLSLQYTVAPLIEGSPGDGQALVPEDYQVTLSQYGCFVPLSDQAEDFLEDNLYNIADELLGEQMGRSLEIITLETLKAGTQRYYAGGVNARNLVVSPVRGSDLSKIIRALDNALAEPITTIISGTVKIGTSPIPAGYRAICHVNHEPDLMAITGRVPFKHVSTYANPDQAQDHEIGAYHRIRFEATTLLAPYIQAGGPSAAMLSNLGDPSVAPNAQNGAAAADVFPILIFGKNWFGTVQLQGFESVGMLVNKPKPQVGNELAQKGSIGWKTYFGCVITGPSWGWVYETAITNNPDLGG